MPLDNTTEKTIQNILQISSRLNELKISIHSKDHYNLAATIELIATLKKSFVVQDTDNYPGALESIATAMAYASK